MRVWTQLILASAVGLGGVIAIAHQVPSARPMLERTGIWSLLDRAGLAPDASTTAVAAGGPPAGGRPGGGRPGGASAASVVASAPEMVPLMSEVAAIGTGMARRAVAVRPEVSGRLAEVLVRSGERVSAGQILARLEAEPETIALTRAELVLSDASAQFERISRLQTSGSASEIQRASAELALRQAELALSQAELDLARRVVTARIDGLAGIVELGVGDQFGPTDTLNRIDDREEIVIDFNVPERFVGRIALGADVSATPLARPELRLDGHVQAIENRVDPATRSIRVQAVIANDEDALRAGMAFAIRMSFEGERYPAVNPLAIQWSSEGSFVWVVREGQALRLPVGIVQRSARQVLVQAEFLPGDMVVTEGVQALRPGGAVEVRGMPADDRAASRPAQQG